MSDFEREARTIPAEDLEEGDLFRVPGWPTLIPRGEWAVAREFYDYGDGVTVVHSFGESFLDFTDEVEVPD